MQIVSLSFFRFATAGRRAWAFAQMGLSRGAFRAVDGAGFVKMFGSGTGAGFTPLPNLSVYAVLSTWETMEEATAATARAQPFARYRDRAAEAWTVYLTPISSRGRWDGQAPFTVDDPQPTAAPLAVLTRATIRPSKALSFWKHEPAISRTIAENADVFFKAGVGEVPWLQQVTFSIWPNMRAMSAFAYRSLPHYRAIRAVRQGDWFREELFARFAVIDCAGTWDGVDPLAACRNQIAERAEDYVNHDRLAAQ
ncbi:MAG: spheroidene monooxygenase [Pseudomonadota bacterium]